MANWQDPQTNGVNAATVGVPTVARDTGLRSYMLKVYNYMASGVLLTGIVAMLFAESGLAAQVLATPLRWLIIFAPLGFVMAMSFGLNRMSTGTLQILFWAFAGAMGLSLSSLFLVYTGASIAQSFFAVSAGFLGLSLFGYTTKKDLTGFGSFLIIGVVGLVIASLVNMFLQNSVMGFLISVVGVLVFAGLIAYDTQRLKISYYQMGGDQAAMGVATNYGALNLYINFINLFQFLLSIFGSRR
jgi:hypothetical protein